MEDDHRRRSDSSPLKGIATGSFAAGLVAALGWVAAELLSLRERTLENRQEITTLQGMEAEWRLLARADLADIQKRLRALEYSSARAEGWQRPPDDGMRGN